MNHESLSFAVTDEASAEFKLFLSSITEYEPTLCFMKTRLIEESEIYWTYGAYSQENVATVKAMAERGGYPFLHSVGGIPVVIGQAQFLGELVGKRIGVGKGGKLVLESAP